MWGTFSITAKKGWLCTKLWEALTESYGHHIILYIPTAHQDKPQATIGAYDYDWSPASGLVRPGGREAKW